MFHFELVHVKGVFHGPDSLSRRPRQPDDPDPDTSDNEIYEDWVDQMYGFMHLIQLLPPFIHLNAPKNVLLPALIPYIPAPKPTVLQFTSTRILATEEAENNDSEEEPEQSVRRSEEPEELRDDNQTLTYDMVPQSAKAKAEEKRLKKVKQWLNNMKRPVSMEDKEYSKFILVYGNEIVLEPTN
ncbi:hypothetical protein C0995_006205 [Termitomyces sp. Mi166|nr:hypothetical protein C0995_006205 [Termitomyces sp. Mi166\